MTIIEKTQLHYTPRFPRCICFNFLFYEMNFGTPHWVRIIARCNYLYGNGIDPIALDAQLEGIHAYKPIGAGIDARHNAN